MNFNIPRKILIYSLLLFTFSSLISSVFSNEDSINKIRNLEDSDIPESDISTITKVNCNSTEDLAKCDIDHMTCENQTLHLNCTCNEGYFSNFNNELPGEKYCSIEQKKQFDLTTNIGKNSNDKPIKQKPLKIKYDKNNGVILDKIIIN